MANRRGRPTGYIMSEESKAQISTTKTGQHHTPKTRRKIARSVKKYFKTPEGKAHSKRMSIYLNDFWSSSEGLDFRESLGESMRDYYDIWYRDEQ